MAFKRLFIFSFLCLVYTKICISSSYPKLIDAVILACSLSLAILWQGELRRLMELLGTGRLAVLLGNPPKEFRATSTTVNS